MKGEGNNKENNEGDGKNGRERRNLPMKRRSIPCKSSNT